MMNMEISDNKQKMLSNNQNIYSINLNFKEKIEEKIHSFFTDLRLKVEKKNKSLRKTLKNIRISQEFSKIINEEYKNSFQNNQKHFLSLYKRNEDIDLQEYFKEGKENHSYMPSFLMNRFIYTLVGILFFLKFLNKILF